MTVDWAALTAEKAKRLVGSASAHELRQARRYNDGEITEAAWHEAYMVFEDLKVFALTGDNPRAGALA